MPKGKSIEVKYETLVVIWLALILSQIIFFFVVLFIRPELRRRDPSQNFFGDMPLITVVFIAIAVVFLALSLILRRQYIRRAVRDQDQGCIHTGLVLGCALAEVPSLLGLVLAFGFNHPYFYFWIFLGTIGILLHFPQKSVLEAASYKLKA